MIMMPYGWPWSIDYSSQARQTSGTPQGHRGLVARAGGTDHVRPPAARVRDQLTQRMPHASAHKMFAIYD